MYRMFIKWILYTLRYILKKYFIYLCFDDVRYLAKILLRLFGLLLCVKKLSNVFKKRLNTFISTISPFSFLLSLPPSFLPFVIQ